MSRQRILWLCSWYPTPSDPFNGDFIQRHARAAALYNDIHVIHLAAYGEGPGKAMNGSLHREGGLTEQIVYYKKGNSLWERLRAHYRWMFLFRKTLRNFVVKYGRPHLVHVQVPMKAGIMARWFMNRYKVPYLVTEHWGIYNSVVKDNFQARNKYFRLYTRKIFKKAIRFISVSRYLAEGVNRLVCRKEYEVIPNVTDTRYFFFSPVPKQTFRFIHVSNMVPLKNTEGILRSFAEAYKQNKDAELVLVGDRDPAIHAVARSLYLPEGVIQFRGEIAYEHVAAEMQQAHCLVLFSHIENSPCVIGEALCCGLPVIATNTGGIPEMVDETNGILIEPGDEAALTEAMLRMVRDWKLFYPEEIANKATGRYSYETVGARLDRVYRQITDHRV